MDANQFQQFFQHSMRSQIVMRSHLCKLEAFALMQSLGRKPAIPLHFTSQFGEDAILWELFDGQPDGFYIEVGASDGVLLSVSHAFEAIGWKGLLIEAIPEEAEKCRANRPNSRVVQAALGPPGSSGTTQFNVVRGGEGSGLSFHTTTPEHQARIASSGATSAPVSVPFTTMNDLLADHAGAIDFASIDVEGGELPLLEGFDLRKFRPRVLLVEENSFNRDSQLNQHLVMHEYRLIGRVAVTNLYVHRDQKQLLHRWEMIGL